MQVRTRAFTYPGGPQQTLTITANATRGGGSCAPLPLTADWQTVECTLDESAWRAGVNVLDLRFGYTQRPVDVGVGGDTRPLSAAVDWVRVSISTGTAR